MKLLQKLRDKWTGSKGDIAWLIEQSKGVKRYILGFLAISLLGMLFSLVSPYAGKLIVDSVTGEEPNFSFGLVMLMLGTSLFSILLSSASSVFNSYVNEKFAFSVRARMFDRTQRGKWKELKRFHSGDMLARLNGDVDVISSNIISILPNLIVFGLQLLIVLIIVLSVDPMLAVIGLVAGPIGLAVSMLCKKPLQRCQKQLRESQSEYFTFFQEGLANIGVVKSFQMEERNNEAFAALREKRLKTVVRAARIRAVMTASMSIVYTGAYVTAFAWCANQLSRGAYSYGTMTMFLALVTRIQNSIGGLGGILPQLFATVISTKRVREITELGEETLDGPADIPDEVGLRAEHVSFTYEDEVVLKDISLEIPAHSRVGIIGSSGAGKTTFIRLLLALIEPDGGKLEYVLPDGTCETVSPSSRRLLSYVPQGNTLLTGTVRENLLTGCPDADEAALWNALDLADAAEFVRRDPDGLDMQIKENSGGVSAGQAQRICIARALLRERPVLIFDEATSALDEKTERRIFERLIAKSTKTCFIITHRSSMLQYCDTVMEVRDDGGVSVRRL